MSTKNSTDVKSSVKLAPKQKTEIIEPDSFIIKVNLPFVHTNETFNGNVNVSLYHSNDLIHSDYFSMIQNASLDSYVQTAFSNYQRDASISKD